MEVCKLCNKGCELIPSQQRDGYFTKGCRFVKRLEFDRRTHGWIMGGHKETITAVFSDLMQHKTDEKILYLANGDPQPKQPSGNGPCVISVKALVSKLQTDYPQRLDLEITNIAKYYSEGFFRMNQTDKGFLHSLVISPSEFGSIKQELESLCLFGYLSKDEHDVYHITPKGYEVAQSRNISRTAFIALSYKDNDVVIEAISKCIKKMGFEPIIMRDLPLNNYIMPEMLKQISDCRFLVCDLTIPNFGAYFETGYAMGLGRPVILSCSKDVFDSKDTPHFDLHQYNTLTWINLDDLDEKLSHRIKESISSS